MAKSDNKATLTDKQMIEKMEIPFTPIDGRVLVKPLEPIYLKVEETVFKADEDKQKKKSLKEVEKGGETETETITKEVKANVRRGTILALPKQTINTKANFPADVGDTIVYHEKPYIFKFDLFRDSVLIDQYEILGLWDITKEKDRDIYNRTYPKSDTQQQTGEAGS